MGLVSFVFVYQFLNVVVVKIQSGCCYHATFTDRGVGDVKSVVGFQFVDFVLGVHKGLSSSPEPYKALVKVG